MNLLEQIGDVTNNDFLTNLGASPFATTAGNYIESVVRKSPPKPATSVNVTAPTAAAVNLSNTGSNKILLTVGGIFFVLCCVYMFKKYRK